MSETTQDASAPPARRRRRVWRTPILIVVAAAVVAAIVAQRDAPTPDGHAESAVALAGASLPPADALSAAWYCDEGTSSPDGRADERVVVASMVSTRVTATVTVMTGGDAAPVSRRLRLAPHQQRTIRVADIVQSPEPGVVVEVEGGQAVVSHELVNGSDLAVEPCTRSAATDWYFAAGTTVKGAQHFLVLFNPFGDDAIVDVTFLTDTGVQQPDALQAVVVPRRSRLTIAVHDAVPRQNRIATLVHARAGRIVAERTQIFDGTVPDEPPTRKGIAVSLGVTQTATVWHIAANTTRGQGSASLALANFAATDTTVAVVVALPGNRTFEPRAVQVPSRSVVALDVAARVPLDTDYSITVTARPTHGGRAVPVVAETLATWPATSSIAAVATTLGSVHAARRWIVATPDTEADVYLTVLDSGPGSVEATLRRARGATGRESRTIKGGHVGVLHVSGVHEAGGALVVTADRPVVVGLTVLGDAGASNSEAIPDPGFGG